MHRRHFLLGSSALLVAGCGARKSSLAIPSYLEETVAWIEGTGRARLVQRAGRALDDGTSREDIERALLIACCRQLPFSELGGYAHPLWHVTVAWELGQRADQGVLALMHALDRFKQGQNGARSEALENVSELDEAAVISDEAALVDAFDNWDAEAADVAAVGLLRDDPVRLRAVVLRYGLRSVGAIGHVQVHTALVIRALDRLGWDESVVRTVVYGLITEKDREAHLLAPWDDNLTRIGQLPDDWALGEPDDTASIALVPALRTRDSDEAVQALLDAFAAGVRLPAAWDALRLSAAELSLRHAGDDGVFPGFHTMTGLNGCRWLLENAPDDDTARMALLQAAALLAVNRAEAEDRGEGGSDLDIVRITGGGRGSAEGVLDLAGEDREAAAGCLVAWLDAGGSTEDFIAVQGAGMLARAVEEHHIKLPVAAWEEAADTHPALASRVLAAGLAWGVTRADPEWPYHLEALEVAARAG